MKTVTWEDVRRLNSYLKHQSTVWTNKTKLGNSEVVRLFSDASDFSGEGEAPPKYLRKSSKGVFSSSHT